MKNIIKKISVGILLTLLIAGGFLIYNNQKPLNDKKKETFSLPDKNNESAIKYIYLYFTDEDSEYLKAEKRKIRINPDSTEYMKTIMEMLLDGPVDKKLISTIPEKTKILSLFIKDHSTAVVDFSEEIRDNHPGGSQSELLTIYSIVDTLTLNIKEIKRVKILINGKEADTLAGHIALNFPLKENLDFIR